LLPSDDFFRVDVEKSFLPVPGFDDDFNNQGTEFIGHDFEIKSPSGFLNGVLNSPHPYLSPEDNNLFYNYSTLLRYPIVIAKNGTMNFDEIVLVEPGEPGTVFGDEEFWDYVIVEGSKDYGDTWLPLIDGYDSRSNVTWNAEYNNGVDINGNSQTVGTKEMFIRRNINLTENGNFVVGDTIFVRFRLFSDPFSHGWGWAIDNLRIQTIVSEPDLSLSPGDFRVYPNPASNKIMVEFLSNQVFNESELFIFDNFGRQVFNNTIDLTSPGFRKEIDLSSYQPGLYLIQVIADGKQIMSRKIVRR
jgi:hypothetical protein